MNILQLLSFSMLALILMGMLARVRPYSKIPKPGKIISVLPLNLFSKIWLNRFNLGALMTGLALTYLMGWLPLNVLLMVVAFSLVILLMPMKLTVTSQGFALGEAFFREWKEFSGYKLTKTSFKFFHPSKLMSVILFLNPTQNGPLIKTIENHIPAALPTM